MRVYSCKTGLGGGDILDDREVIASVLRGMTDDFGILVKRYFEKVYRICLSLCGNGFDAEDALQETFIDAFIYLSSLSEPDKFSSWVCTIARRKSYRQIALKHCDADIDDMAEILPSSLLTPLDSMLAAERSQQISEALERLSDKKRIVAEMFYFQDMKIKEISENLSLSENTVKSRLYDVREYLRKELDNMDHTDNMALLERRIKESVEKLSRYYALNGGELDDGFRNGVADALKLIGKLGDTEKKQSYTALALQYKLWDESLGEDERRSVTERMKHSADMGKNAEVIANALVDDVLAMTDDRQRIAYIDNTAMPLIDKYTGSQTYDAAKGTLLFWRGRYLLELDRYDEARSDFETAARLIDKSSSYQANAVAALLGMDRMKENVYGKPRYFGATAEGILSDEGKVIFANQPGFSAFLNFPHIGHDFSSFMYYASRCRMILIDVGLKPHDRLTDVKNNASLECIAADDVVKTPAGEFAGCLHMRTEAVLNYVGQYTIDAWYAPDVGPVRFSTVCEGKTEVYELAEYAVEGGSGYMPFAVGNKWVYINPDLPDWIYQRIERTVEYTDGKFTNFAVTDLFALAKDFENANDLDSSIYLSLADSLCDEWKIEDAIEMLKKAVRLNIDERSVCTSLFGIEVLNRFLEYQKQGYRFCPSSIDASVVKAGDTRAQFFERSEWSFGPYRWGARGRYEDRIFGIKPFRYLQQHMHEIWNDKWIVGYHESREIKDGLKLCFSVEDGGKVTVPAGEFENCRKITLRVDKPDDADDKWYFSDGYANTGYGLKEYWFAPGVGIVKFVSTWGSECYAECLLSAYSAPASGPDEYLPIHIGNAWEYDEPHLTSEGYRAKTIFRIASGMSGSYLMTHSQEFICLKTEQEYNEFVKTSHRY